MRAPGNAVAVDVEIAAEFASRLEIGGGHAPCRGRTFANRPTGKGSQRCEFMPMSRSSMTKIGVCNRSARSKASAPNSKASPGPSGNSITCLVSPCEANAQTQNVRLLRARRHAGRRAAALNVEHDGRDLGEIGETEEFLHQRDARPRRRRESARAIPAGADRHADRRDFVLGLDDRVAFFSPVARSTRRRAQFVSNASASEVEGVIGYHAQTVAPP